MKLKDARDIYYFYSGKTSDIVRALGLAGVAIAWLFKVEQQGVPKLPAVFKGPLVLIVAGLALDLLQYAVATGIWGVYQRKKELARTAEQDEFQAPSALNYPTITLFVAKVACVIAAYLMLLQQIALTIF
jgi:hypothetical protein